MDVDSNEPPNVPSGARRVVMVVSALWSLAWPLGGVVFFLGSAAGLVGKGSILWWISLGVYLTALPLALWSLVRHIPERLQTFRDWRRIRQQYARAVADRSKRFRSDSE